MRWVKCGAIQRLSHFCDRRDETAASKLIGNAMWQQDTYHMIQRRAVDAGIKTSTLKRNRYSWEGAVWVTLSTSGMTCNSGAGLIASCPIKGQS